MRTKLKEGFSSCARTKGTHGKALGEYSRHFRSLFHFSSLLDPRHPHLVVSPLTWRRPVDGQLREHFGTIEGVEVSKDGSSVKRGELVESEIFEWQ